MTPDDVIRHFEETNGLLSGHFKLSSGLHSDRYLQCAKVLQWPERAGALGAALGALLGAFRPDVVVSPAMGGLVIGHEVGRALGRRAVFAERVDGVFSLRRGFALEKDERAVVVEDVLTTGKSTREVLDLVRALGAAVVGCGAIVDRRPAAERSGGDAVAGVPFRALVALDVATWKAEECPHCQAGKTVIAPGSRFL